MHAQYLKMQCSSLLLVCVVLICELTSSVKAFPVRQTRGVEVEDESTTSTPDYISELYRCWTGQQTDGCPSWKYQDVDRIRSFVGKYEADAPPAIQSYNHDVELSNSMAIVFSANASIRQNEVIHNAEIRIYKFAVSEIQLESKCPGITSRGVDVQLYATVSNSGESDVVGFLKRVTLTKEELTEDRWVVFQTLTRMYEDFMSEIFTQTHNSAVTIRLALDAPCSGVNPIELGFTTQEGKEATFIVYSTRDPEERMEMQAALDDLQENAPPAGSRKRRQADDNEVHYDLPRPHEHLQEGRCQLHSYTVSFSEIGLSKVVQPTSFHPNVCLGRCTWPIKNSSNPTEHAQIQAAAAAHLPSNEGVPGPCCVPIEHRPIQVVVKMSEGEHDRQTWYNAEATECGCR